MENVKQQRGFTLIELMIVVAIVGIIIAVIVGVVNRPSRDERCAEICDGLRQKKVKVTPDVCICEDSQKTRQAYPMGRAGGNYAPAAHPGMLEAEF